MLTTGGVRAAGLICSLIATWVLARLLDAPEFGRLSLTVVWAWLLGAIATMGTDQLLLRELSISPGSWPALRRFVTRRVAYPTALVVAASLPIAAVQLGGLRMAPALSALAILTGVIRRQQSALLAHGRTSIALVGEIVLIPILHVAICAPILLLHLGPASAVVVALSQATAMVLVVAVQRWAARPIRSDTGAAEEVAQPEMWHRATRRLAVVGTLAVIQGYIELIILGALGTSAEVANFVVATRIASLVALPMAVATVVISRDTARSFAGGELRTLQPRLTAASRLAALSAAVVLLAILAVHRLVLATIGAGFSGATTPLLILLGAQVTNVCIGPVATVLTLTGHERHVRDAVVIAAITGAAVSAALAPRFGATGAAIGASASLLCWNVLLRWRVARDLGVATGPIGAPRGHLGLTPDGRSGS